MPLTEEKSELCFLLSGRAPRRALLDYGLELLADLNLLPTRAQYVHLAQAMTHIETDFLGFGNAYALARDHMSKLSGIKTVVDIGCAWGIWSYMFGDYKYIGIEEYDMSFCRYFDHHEIIRGAFPFTTASGDCFIASMSLGYGGRLYREKESAEGLLLDKLSQFRYGYYGGDEKILDLLGQVFERMQLGERGQGDRLWFLERR